MVIVTLITFSFRTIMRSWCSHWIFSCIIFIGVIQIHFCQLHGQRGSPKPMSTSTSMSTSNSSQHHFNPSQNQKLKDGGMDNSKGKFQWPLNLDYSKSVGLSSIPNGRWQEQSSSHIARAENYQNFKFKQPHSENLNSDLNKNVTQGNVPVATVFVPSDVIISVFYGKSNPPSEKLEISSPIHKKPQQTLNPINQIQKRIGQFSQSDENEFKSNFENEPLLHEDLSDLNSASFEASQNLEENREEFEIPKGTILIPPPGNLRTIPSGHSNPDPQSIEMNSKSEDEWTIPKGAIIIPPLIQSQSRPDPSWHHPNVASPPPQDSQMASSNSQAQILMAQPHPQSDSSSFESEEQIEIPKGAILIPPPLKRPTWQPPSTQSSMPQPENGFSIDLDFSAEFDPPKFFSQDSGIEPQVAASNIKPAPQVTLPLVPFSAENDGKSIEEESFEIPKGAILIPPPPKRPTWKPPSIPAPMPQPSENEYSIDLGFSAEFDHPELFQQDPGSQVDPLVLPSKNYWEPQVVSATKNETKVIDENFEIPKGAILIPARSRPLPLWRPSMSTPEAIEDSKVSMSHSQLRPSPNSSPQPFKPPVKEIKELILQPRPPPPPRPRWTFGPKLDPYKVRILKNQLWKIKRIGEPLVEIAGAGYVAYKLIHTIDYLHHIKKHSNSSFPLTIMAINHILAGIKFPNTTTTGGQQMMNPLSFLPILTTSAALTIIAVSTFMRFVIGGPIMSLLFLMLTSIMSPGIVRAIGTVHRINQIVPLTTYGKIVTGVRSFLGMSPTEHLPLLGGVRVYNREISKNAAQFLRTNPDIHTIITPSIKETKKRLKRPSRIDPWWCQIPGLGSILAQAISGSGCEGAQSDSYTQFKGTYEPHKNSYVNLTSFYVNPKSRKDVPTTLGEFSVFCGDQKSKKKKSKSKFCTNAIALGQRGFKSTATNYYFDLKDGNDTAIGRRGYQNTFMVEQGQKFYQGQDKDDTFVLVQEGASGLLDGGSGENFLILKETFDPTQFLTLNLSTSSLNLSESSITQSSGAVLKFLNVNKIEGRSGEGEKFIVGCGTKFIDGKSGKSMQVSDVIEIPWNFSSTSNSLKDFGSRKISKKVPNNFKSVQLNSGLNSCRYNMTIKLSKFTKVFNHALQGNFTYIFPSTPSESRGIELNIFGLERLDYDQNGRHKIILDWKLSQLNSIVFQKGPQILSMSSPNSNFYLSTKVIRSSLKKKNKNKRRGEKNRLYFQQPTFYTMLDDHLTPEAEIQVTPSGHLNIVHKLDSKANSISNERQGFSMLPNIFQVHEGHWILRGGLEADIFKIHKKFTGYIDGGGSGENLILLDRDFSLSNSSRIGASHSHVEINLSQNYLTYSSEEPVKVTVENIQKVIGRRDISEDIILNCQSTDVDGRGGYSGRQVDYIEIPRDDSCQYKINMVIRDHTVVQNFARKGQFFYKIVRHGVFDVGSTFPLKTSHNYILPETFKQIKKVIFDLNTNRMSFQYKVQNDSGLFHGGHWVKFSKDLNKNFNVAPNIWTKDGIQFKANRVTGDLTAFIQFKNGNGGSGSGKFSNYFNGLDGIHHWIDLANVTGVNIKGGDLNDTFVLEPVGFVDTGVNWISGSLDGMDGDNILKISNGFLPQQSIYIDFIHHQLILDDDDTKLNPLKIFNISTVYGRPDGNETIVVGCDTKYFDGQGGHDMVIVNDLTHCQGHDQDHVQDDDDDEGLLMEFAIKNSYNGSTRVFNSASWGTFIYRLDTLAPFQVETQDRENDDEPVDTMDHWTLDQSKANHIYQYGFSVNELEKLKFQQKENDTKIIFKIKGKFKQSQHSFFSHHNSKSKSDWESLFYDQPKFLTKDKVYISVKRESGEIFFSFNQKDDKVSWTIESIVRDYEVIANKLNVTMVLVNLEGESILVQDESPLNKVFVDQNHEGLKS